MRREVAALAMAITMAAPAAAQEAAAAARDMVPGTSWRIVAPEAHGWSRAGLARADSIAGVIGTAAYVVVADGLMLWSWGDVARPYRAHSVRKSLLDVLYGVQGVDLSVTLGELGIGAVPPLAPREREARLEHLLESRSGVYRRAAHESEGWDRVRPARGSHAPGEWFFYSNWDFNVAGLAWQILAGRNLFEAFEREVARPLGMEDYASDLGAWRYDLDRSPHPAFVFRISARDLARVGLLYLRKGRWGGHAILPAGWVAESTRPRSRVTHPRTGEPIDGVAYGRLWWVALPGGGPHGVRLGPGAFWASGTGEQLLAVDPARQLVFVHREDTDRGDERVTGEELARLLEAVLAARPGRRGG